MENDQFLSVHDAIRKVTFVVIPDNPIDTDDVDENENEPIGFFSGSLILAVAVGLALALTLCLTVRRRKPIQDTQMMQGKERSSTNNYSDWIEDIISADDNTVQVSNRGSSNEAMNVNVDLETFSHDGNKVGDKCFEFFDIFLEGTSSGRKEKNELGDDFSAVSF